MQTSASASEWFMTWPEIYLPNCNISPFDSTRAKRLATMSGAFTADSACVSVIVKDAILPVFASVVSLIAMFAVLWQIDKPLALLSLTIVPYMMLIFALYAERMMELSYKQQQVESNIYGHVEQTFQHSHCAGISAVKS